MMNWANWTYMGVTMTADDVMEQFIPYAERIVVTGCHGLLGQKLHELLSSTNDIIGIDLSADSFLTGNSYKYISLDITRRSEVVDAILENQPGIIINTAAITGVDRCEDERELCWRVNVHAVENLIRAAAKVDAHLIQISSDYVFDGNDPPYRETDLPRPLGFYGKSKLAAENAMRGSDIQETIVRTQLLYGVAPMIRSNFVDFIRTKLECDEDLQIVDDQIGNPTLADDLARGIARIIQLRKRGIYHISGSESISRYDFAREIARTFDEDPNRISAMKTNDLDQKALRPQNSTFCLDKIAGELRFKPFDVKNGLNEYRKQLTHLKAAIGGKSL
ncbi:dTDP-4-dehydrorhamnose reductase [candidate division LCP-89 bacterium B3_LCP]|uniref:dTDP-4-dehydrorhamnose reductase n=1 Tax=candidate division LCP-89 bacterium B3_LCP TaxID=2012998 RepID=A0A532UTX4_UNCL8|nr:MAG: dTDP-4-dehydrorhamnose reductase [candidate division LCP-89 bacterium B3_LCP]